MGDKSTVTRLSGYAFFTGSSLIICLLFLISTKPLSRRSLFRIMLSLFSPVLKSSLIPAVALRIIISINRAKQTQLTSAGCLNHDPKRAVVETGISARPIAIPIGRLLLGGPPSFMRYRTSCPFCLHRGTVLIRAPIAMGTAKMSRDRGASAMAMPTPVELPFSPLNLANTGHI